MFATTDFGDAALDTEWFKYVQKRKGPAILITKNIKRLLTDFDGLLNEQVIAHATITGLGGSFLEPNVPHPNELLAFLKTIKEKEKIVIRIDPIIPIDDFINRAKQIFLLTKEMGFKRHRISILDVYPHVMERFSKYPDFQKQIKEIYRWDMDHNISDGEHKEYMIHCDAILRKKIIGFFPGAEICAEPPIRSTPCVSWKDCEALGLNPADFQKPDKKQRQFCGCLEKKELLLLNKKCAHECCYCYKTCQ
jgi:DNA repair photolyase